MTNVVHPKKRVGFPERITRRLTGGSIPSVFFFANWKKEERQFTFLEEAWQYFDSFPKSMPNTLAQIFVIQDPSLELISNAIA
jgi:hypothetical protein